MKSVMLIAVISSFIASSRGRTIYTSGPSLNFQPRSSSFISHNSRVVPHRVPLRITAKPQIRQRPFGLGLQSTFKSLHRPPFYPRDHHAFPSRRRFDHSYGGDFFTSHRRHRHTLHSETRDRREHSRRRRRMRRLIQRHREEEEKAALQEAKRGRIF